MFSGSGKEEEDMKKLSGEKTEIDFEPAEYPPSGKLLKEFTDINTKSLFICALLLFVLMVWTGSTVFEIVQGGIVKKVKHPEAEIMYENQMKSSYSHPECGKVICTGDCRKRFRRMVGGEEAGRGEWPWMAGITINNHFTCGGVLLNDRYVLTAAHCLHRGVETVEDVEITLGSVHRNLPATERQKHGVCNYVIHEQFNPITLENDLALLKLKRPATFTKHVLPACIPKVNENKTGVMIGWGKYRPGGPFSPSLRQVRVPVVPHEECKKQNDQLYRRVKVYPDMHLCTGYGKHRPEYACTGDSGGGFFQQRLHRWYVQGIVSWIDPTCNSTLHNTFTVMTNVARYSRWLGNNMDLDFLTN